MIDTAEIFYHMESAVSHLPIEDQYEALLIAAFDLVTRAEQFDRTEDSDE